MSYGILGPSFGRCSLLKHFNRIPICVLSNPVFNDKELSNMCRTRSFMSEGFQCKEVWQERLKVPPISTLEINKYYFELERKFTRDGLYFPIDVDIFANALLKPDGNQASLKAERIQDRFDQMQEILQRFRQTPQTNFMLPSTTHAVIKAFLEGDGTDKLMNILADRERFGMFPDKFSLIQMMNHFLTSSAGSNWRDASKVAILMMLQEEYDAPVACEMGVYAAYEYTQTDAFRDMNEEEANWNPIQTELPPESEDEIKVRVWFADNNYFDDHFDLKKREHLIGKTLAKFAQCSKRQFLHGSGHEHTAVIRNSLELLGWTLFEKWDKVSDLITQIGDGSGVSKRCLDDIHFFANKTTSNTEIKESTLISLSKLKTIDIDISSYLSDQVKAFVAEDENELIDDQLSTYIDWNKQRKNELKRKMEMWEANERKQHLEQRKQELNREEEKLFFFENYERTEKEKEAKYRKWRKSFPHKSGIKIDPDKTTWRHKGQK